ncbi:DUF1848 domain-containing protein [Leadbettera azotonutricia]|uniref:DUF1848 domain-containing protein n=1 Tax=Leadbettera azotonutricia (strain ATCC BAA-888 / DSM 13862 / ZAS-9) TaxID=545695 RepID=F5Y9G6_LEAAZ|nr:DUF1848 domain-containing protein [Leadbettera azotonutricia]AEF82638.1 conserved hypothetical protein [Leadbettera azotonutricia ZAS-9]
MIISASRRTDIPAFFGDWFMNRLAGKKVLARNPMNPNSITEIPLEPDLIECIVFWSKNPEKFFKHLPIIDKLGYRYYFQFTLNAYDSTIEKNIDKRNILGNFIELSEYLGKEKIIWRYDPILVNDKFTIKYHIENFESLCKKLYRHTEKCVISFIDTYSFLNENFRQNNIHELPNDEMDNLADKFATISKKYNLQLSACCEKINLDKYGISHNKCIDDDLIERLFNVNVKSKKDPSQRKECGCCVSRDIGAYNTCLHDCIYCYAKRGIELLHHDPHSPLLCDIVNGTEKINQLELNPVEKIRHEVYPVRT